MHQVAIEITAPVEFVRQWLNKWLRKGYKKCKRSLKVLLVEKPGTAEHSMPLCSSSSVPGSSSALPQSQRVPEFLGIYN